MKNNIKNKDEDKFVELCRTYLSFRKNNRECLWTGRELMALTEMIKSQIKSQISDEIFAKIILLENKENSAKYKMKIAEEIIKELSSTVTEEEQLYILLYVDLI